VASDDIEVTLEVHPATVDVEGMRRYRAAGINRLSIGVQSFSETRLRCLGRQHTAVETCETFDAARVAGFDNLSIDLIFALPGLTRSDWEETLATAVAWGPEHLSLYALSVETGTRFHRQGVTPASDDDAAIQYQCAQQRLAAAGYLQYEISNFARPGRACRHNLRYWNREDILGLGLSACSYVGGKQWENTDVLTTYLDEIERGTIPVSEMAPLDARQIASDRILFGLRKSEGIPRAWVAADPGMMREVTGLMEIGLLERASDWIRLTSRGMLLADTVAVALMPS